MTTLSVWHGDGYDNVDIFGLGGIDAAIAEQVQDLLLPTQHTAMSK